MSQYEFMNTFNFITKKLQIKRDETLNEVFDLEYNEAATRDFKGGKWTRKKLENYEEQ